jgi:hypothetical protein
MDSATALMTSHRTALVGVHRGMVNSTQLNSAPPLYLEHQLRMVKERGEGEGGRRKGGGGGPGQRRSRVAGWDGASHLINSSTK